MADELNIKRIIELQQKTAPEEGDSFAVDNANSGTSRITIQNLLDPTFSSNLKAAPAEETKKKIDEVMDVFAGGIDEAVDNWLDEHPEATTTVQDGSLTYKKLVTGTLGFVTLEMFGAKGDGVNDDTEAIQSAIDSGKGIVIFKQGATYRITDTLFIDSNTTLDLNGSVIFGDFENNTHPIIKNKNYGGTGVENISIINGTIKGVGAEGNTSDQGHAIALFVANNVLIKNINTVNTCGDGIGTRKCENCNIENVNIGDFGRNGISPTSGSYVFTNVNVVGVGFTGANPANTFDAEINSTTEHWTGIFNNCKFKSMTFVDFYSAEGAEFPFDIIFNGVEMINSDYAGLRFKSTNKTIAKNIVVDKMHIVAPAYPCIRLEKVSGIIIDGCCLESTAPTGGTASAISMGGDGAVLRNLDLSAWTGSGRGLRGKYENCIFENVITRVYVSNGIFSNNIFRNCNIIAFEDPTGTASSNNKFINTTAPETLLRANNQFLPVGKLNYVLGSGESIIVNRSNVYYKLLIACRAGALNSRALYYVSGYSYGEARNNIDKILGSDMISVTFDESSLVFTITNSLTRDLNIDIIVMNGDSFTVTTPQE